MTAFICCFLSCKKKTGEPANKPPAPTTDHREKYKGVFILTHKVVAKTNSATVNDTTYHYKVIIDYVIGDSVAWLPPGGPWLSDPAMLFRKLDDTATYERLAVMPGGSINRERSYNSSNIGGFVDVDSLFHVSVKNGSSGTNVYASIDTMWGTRVK